MKQVTVALLFGGRSAEHEISIISAQSVARHINPDHYRVVPIYITRNGRWYSEGIASSILELDIAALIRKSGTAAASLKLQEMVLSSGQQPFSFTFAGIDIAFPILHGSYGEDGRIQGFLDTVAIPYTGCGVTASALTMDKALSKLCVSEAGIAVAPGVTVLAGDWEKSPEQILSSIPETLIYPVFVKPAHLGSSVGISKVSVQGELPEALAHACNLDTKVLIEQAMHGKEIEVAVLGNNDPIASACGEIEPGSDFYDYDDKYIHNTAKLFIPARLPEELSRRVQADALTAYRALGCRGMARVDFFVDEKSGQVVFNEINTIPGFTDISMYPQLMEAAGIAFPELCDRLLQLALEPEQPAKT
ncbi:D-alanine--D-alanine ligase [Chlorobium phaeovibrioides]|uniref:D-alanine--D-alanine ligase n=1 Tax=Chlorobium phaeovibrioides TaxID=1094 RepID=A0A3S0MPX3_CHLPH|nr:D-alanine--D-alanine ligase family protein [Chlorobium phaeovibrioides]RTY36843.1 D-alanine--D-alanine ligase [Chlorobium phaeovibrioides]